MDINYILGREQTSLHNALHARSACARIVHEKLAAAYGQMLAQNGFPHRPLMTVKIGPAPSNPDEVWENEGGSAQ